MEEVSLLSHHIGPQISTDLLGLRSYTFQGFPSGCQGRRGSPRWPGRDRRPDWANWAKLGPQLVASRARNALNLQWTQWTLPILQCCANTTGYVLRTPCHRDCSNVTHARRNRDKSQSKCKRYPFLSPYYALFWSWQTKRDEALLFLNRGFIIFIDIYILITSSRFPDVSGISVVSVPAYGLNFTLLCRLQRTVSRVELSSSSLPHILRWVRTVRCLVIFQAVRDRQGGNTPSCLDFADGYPGSWSPRSMNWQRLCKGLWSWNQLLSKRVGTYWHKTSFM